MMTIIDKYVAKQLVFACVLAILVLSGPVILVTLFKDLPSDAVFTELFWPSLYGVACMILYVTLPVPIAIAIVWTYGRLASDSILTILHAAGLSTASVRTPAFIVAGCGAALGYAMSCYLAPYSAHNIHDMLFSLRHDILPELLQEGKFNEFSRGRQVIYFSRRTSRTEFADVFIKEVTEGREEKVYHARAASFVRHGDERWIVLHDGSMQVTGPDHPEARAFAFTQIVRPATRSGTPNVRRGNLFYDEIAGLDFVRAAATAFERPATAREWAKEAVKRFGFPALAVIHTILGLELLAAFGGLSARVRHPTASACALVMVFHFTIAVGAENISRFGAPFAWAVVAMMMTELGLAGVLLMLRSRILAGPVVLRDTSDPDAGDPGDRAPRSVSPPKHLSVGATARPALALRPHPAAPPLHAHRPSSPVAARKAFGNLSERP